MSKDRISAVTLETKNINNIVHFYTRMDFILKHRKGDNFVSFSFGDCFLNFVKNKDLTHPSLHGRIIFFVEDVDKFYEKILAAGVKPDMPPSDARWGERYFHVTDPDGNEISFAKPL
ncbi:MAG: VOC family protein [Nitrospinota bacterium]|nr:VOC family protein [Nitrospinota bacterium]